jgi:transposase
MKIIEETPEPQSVTITEYRIAHYRCQRCQKIVTGTDAGCSDKGKFGNNAIAQATLLKYEDRLTYREFKML